MSAARLTDEWTVHWDCGSVTVQSLGGMLAPLTLRLPDGRSVSPLQVAPWGVAEEVVLPGVLRRLRGEWPCIPYGASKPPADLPADWTSSPAEDIWDHGYTANHHWYRVAQDDTSLTIAIDYPAYADIARLQRTVRVTPGLPQVEVELAISARRDCQVPVALHPTFAIPESGVEIRAASASRVETYPVQTEPGVSRLMANTSGKDLDSMPASDGSTLSFTRLPLPFATEELMQMVGCTGPFTLRYVRDSVDVHLTWDTSVLPDALIWVSNGGRAHHPWSSRHFALGVEPMSGFFDLGRVVQPGSEHSLHAEKGLCLKAGEPLVIRYQLEATSS